MTTREQDAVVEHLANAHGAARVTPLPETTAVLAQGWDGGDEGYATTPQFFLAADCDPDAEIEAIDWFARRTAPRDATPAPSVPERAAVRESVVLSSMVHRQASVYVRHAAQGDRTLCGITLGDSIADPPGFDAAFDVEPCYRRVCRHALVALDATPATGALAA